MAVKSHAFPLILVCVLVQPSARAASAPLELKWGEIAPIAAGHVVEVSLRDGSSVKGEAIAVRDDTLVVDVRKSSGAAAFKKGSAAIPRADIALLKVQRSRSAWGRTLGTVIGVVAGLGAGGYAASRTDSGGAAVAIVVVVTAGIAVAGYYAGKQLDRHETVIKIVP